MIRVQSVLRRRPKRFSSESCRDFKRPLVRRVRAKDLWYKSVEPNKFVSSLIEKNFLSTF